MSLSLFEASVPVYLKLLGSLDRFVDKAAAHAAASKFPPGNLYAARLFPDMWSFSEQVKAATNHAFRGTARLAGLPIPAIPEAVATAEEMKARIAATMAFVKSVDAAAIDANRDVTFPLGSEQKTMSAERYFLTFSLPNFYFHLTTAYNILRHNGVPVGKTDFTGEI